jgi:hypothetical protein
MVRDILSSWSLVSLQVASHALNVVNEEIFREVIVAAEVGFGDGDGRADDCEEHCDSGIHLLFLIKLFTG